MSNKSLMFVVDVVEVYVVIVVEIKKVVDVRRVSRAFVRPGRRRTSYRVAFFASSLASSASLHV